MFDLELYIWMSLLHPLHPLFLIHFLYKYVWWKVNSYNFLPRVLGHLLYLIQTSEAIV